MKQMLRAFLVFGAVLMSLSAGAQYRTDLEPEAASPQGDTVILTLDQALQIALSENISVKVADQEIRRQEYAKRGTYASLFPQVSGSGSYQRTIKKQVMYMGGGSSDDEESGGGGMAGMMASAFAPIMHYLNQLVALHPGQITPYVPAPVEDSGDSDGGFEVGRMNTYSMGISVGMPLVNAQLWESLRLSGDQVELAVEQARSSRLDMVTQVKQAFYAVLFAKEGFNVYKSVYENAKANFEQTERRYKAQKASELELSRAASTMANAIPNVYNAESSVMLALWQLKAVMGVDLEMPVDVAGALGDYAQTMFRDIHENENAGLENNTTMRQLAIQAEMLAKTVRMQKFASLPTLSASFAYNFMSMNDDFKFSQYRWTPYSFAGISLSIPIFAGGQRTSQVRQAQVQKTELELQRIQTERQLMIAIRQYLNSMETAMKSYDAAAEAEGLAQKAYDVSARSFEVGKSTLTDLNDAQLVLTQSKLARSQAVYNFVVAKANLEQVIGADFTDPDGTYNPQTIR